jgi:hypothetical protein
LKNSRDRTNVLRQIFDETKVDLELNFFLIRTRQQLAGRTDCVAIE